jgi:hypothetical protein
LLLQQLSCVPKGAATVGILGFMAAPAATISGALMTPLQTIPFARSGSASATL